MASRTRTTRPRIDRAAGGFPGREEAETFLAGLTPEAARQLASLVLAVEGGLPWTVLHDWLEDRGAADHYYPWMTHLVVA